MKLDDKLEKAYFIPILAVLTTLCISAAAQDTADSWYMKGQELGRNGSYEEAVKAYEKAIELNQSFAPALSAKGALLFNMGKRDEAIKDFEKALEIYNETLKRAPRNANIWIDKAVVFSYLGKMKAATSARETALEIFNQTIEKNPNDANAWDGKSYALAGMGRGVDAVYALEKVIELNSSMAKEAWMGKAIAYAELLGKCNESLASWDEAIDLTPANDTATLALLWRSKGKTLEMAGRNEEAISAYEKVIGLIPDEVDAWIGKGFALQYLGRSSEAEASFDRAIELSSDSMFWPAWFGKGEALLAQRKYNEAAQAYEKVIEVNPTHAKSWNDIGISLKALGKIAEAEAAIAKAKGLGYKESILAQENTTESWYTKGQELMVSESYLEAINAFDKTIQIDANNELAWINKAYALSQLNRTEEATEAYQSALDITNKTLETDPQNSSLWADKGLLLHNIGNPEEAAKAFDKATKINPKNEMSWMMLGVTLLSDLHRYNESILAFDGALKINPKNAQIWSLKGDALLALGCQDEADGAYARAKELGYPK